MARAKVFFSRTITPESVVKMYDALGVTLPGRVAVKLHSGEVGNQNFIRPDLLRSVIGHVNGVIVESNTAYAGKRGTSAEHWDTMRLHGWTDVADVDILDEDGDLELPIPDGVRIRRNFVGAHLSDYDSLLVLSHFKGHPMGGFGGALKNISIGIASAHGKAYIHGAGNADETWSGEQDAFLESMADASKSIVDRFGSGRIAFVNIAMNLSADCDCCAVAEDPQLADIGILSSLDPVALDRACVDLVYSSDDPGKKRLIERIESKNGVHTIHSAAKLGVGTLDYELVNVE